VNWTKENSEVMSPAVPEGTYFLGLLGLSRQSWKLYFTYPKTTPHLYNITGMVRKH
jgi:hypothetical protein